VTTVARCALLALDIVLLYSPAWFGRWAGGDVRPYHIATVALLLVNIALVWWWDRASPTDDAPATIAPSASAWWVGLGVVILMSTAFRGWLREILIFPLDPNRADMLVVIQAAIHRLLQGGDPYAMYNVPWPATLPYGPVMWAPLIVPTVMHVDPRFVTLIGFFFFPIACVGVAADEWTRRNQPAAAGWLMVAAAVAFSPEVRHFVSIGHTPVYWPLLMLLAWLVARERWEGAAIVAGLLIVARTTMVAIAPVLLIAVWHRARPRVAKTASLLIAAFALPFLPFAIWNWSSLKYGLYGSYQVVIKGFVWTSTTWAQHTIGITGMLLSHGWQHSVEIVQALVMLLVCAFAAVAIRAGRRPLPWMAFALLAFSMTTLWPVIYIYFDVCLLFVAAALVETPWARSTGVTKGWIGLVGVTVSALVLLVWTEVPINASIDVGMPPARDFLRSGFSGDEHDGAITFAWVDGNRAEIRVPRRSRRAAALSIVCRPNLARVGDEQRLSVAVNGTLVGTASLADGWQTVSFGVPGRAWEIGGNDVTLFLSSAVSPLESGQGGDPRRLSLAVDRVTVESR
jgi:hypothetical protein